MDRKRDVEVQHHPGQAGLLGGKGDHDTGLEDKASLSDSMEHIGIKSVICVPLISKLGTKGVLYLQSVSVAHGFRKGDLLLLSGISTPVALAIDNAELYSESQQAKESLKRARDDLEVEVKNGRLSW